MRIALLRRNVFHHHGTSICLAYIPACILSHVGPLWEFNSAIIMMVVYPTPPSLPTACAALPPPSCYYYCHLRGQIWPCWPSDLYGAHVPGENMATNRSFHCDARLYGCCDICSCIISALRDCFSPLARSCASGRQPRSAQTNRISNSRSPHRALFDVPLGVANGVTLGVNAP